MAVTKRQAQQAFRQVKDQFREITVDIDGANGPKLIKDWDWLDSGPTKWAIVWEGGPHDWAMLAETGGRLEMEYGQTIPPAKRWPAGTFAEAVTSWAVGIYEV